jgi:hypothetical protein
MMTMMIVLVDDELGDSDEMVLLLSEWGREDEVSRQQQSKAWKLH